MIRGTFRFLGKSIAVGAVGTGLIFVPPIESLPSPLVRYRVTCEGFGRLSRCVWVGFQTIYLFKWQLPSDATAAEMEAAHHKTAERLTHLAEVNGGMYIKTGQGFAAQNHLLPKTYWKVMDRLHDAVLNRPIGEICRVIEEEYGKPVDEVFDDFDRNAIAAASLAQVHKARLKGSGELVAVKVQYIDIQQRYDGDFAVIVFMLSIAGRLFPGYDFGKLVKQGDATLRAELDFEQEASNLQRCASDLAKEFRNGEVICPALHKNYSTKRVMVTSFIDGVRADDVKGMKKRGISPVEVGTLLSDTFAYQLFKSRFVHADPHPGNILVRNHPTKGAGKAQCVLLDHGLSFELTPKESKDLAEIWTCCTTHDDDGLRRIMKELGLNGEDDDRKGIFASTWLQYPYDFYDPARRTAATAHVAMMRDGANKAMPVVTEMLEHLPANFALALRNINTYRSVHKTMGAPVSRAGRMLKYSLVSARRDQMGWFSMQHALFTLWWNEFYAKTLIWFVKYFYPEIAQDEELDDLLTVG